MTDEKRDPHKALSPEELDEALSFEIDQTCDVCGQHFNDGEQAVISTFVIVGEQVNNQRLVSDWETWTHHRGCTPKPDIDCTPEEFDARMKGRSIERSRMFHIVRDDEKVH